MILLQVNSTSNQEIFNKQGSLHRSAAPPPPQGLFRPSLPSTGGGEGEGEGREEGGREGRREGEDGAQGPGPGRGRGAEQAGSSAVPGLEPKSGARGFSRSRPRAPLLLFLVP